MSKFRSNAILFITAILCLIFVSYCFCAEDEGMDSESAERMIRDGDLLNIIVIGHEDLNRKVTVDKSGKVPFPLIREILAVGKTLMEFSIALELALSEFIKYPRVTTSFKNNFFVYGEVYRPGEYDLEGYIDVLKAITISGGFTDFASHRVKIIKTSSQKKDIWVNVDNIIKDRAGNKDSQILIEPGDVIVVPGSLL